MLNVSPPTNAKKVIRGESSLDDASYSDNDVNPFAPVEGQFNPSMVEARFMDNPPSPGPSEQRMLVGLMRIAQ